MTFIGGIFKSAALALSDWLSHDLDPIPQLVNAKKISVRLGDKDDLDESIDKYIFENSTKFDPVPFIVFDETSKEKKPILSCKVVSGHGFVVQDFGDEGTKYMTLALLKHEEQDATDVLAELYNANRNLSSRFRDIEKGNILITRPEESKEERKGKVEVDTFGQPLLKFGNAIHVLHVFDTDAYKLTLAGKVFAEVHPKVKHRSYVVQFHDSCLQEVEALKDLALVTALWLMLTKAYTPLGNLLRESMKGKPFDELEDMKENGEEEGESAGADEANKSHDKKCCLIQ